MVQPSLSSACACWKRSSLRYQRRRTHTTVSKLSHLRPPTTAQTYAVCALTTARFPRSASTTRHICAVDPRLTSLYHHDRDDPTARTDPRLKQPSLPNHVSDPRCSARRASRARATALARGGTLNLGTESCRSQRPPFHHKTRYRSQAGSALNPQEVRTSLISSLIVGKSSGSRWSTVFFSDILP